MLIEAVMLSLLLSGFCEDGDRDAGQCSINGSIDNNEVILEGEQSDGGGDGSSQPGPAEPGLESRCTEADLPTSCDAPTRERPDPLVTMSDIAAFRPTAASHGMEPNGWAVIGLPANFFSSGSPVIRSGTLLGGPAEVRFTPVSWSWDYGDGSRRTTATPGRAWRTEFDETATTHVFEQRGTYVVTLVVQYRAEWRVAGGPWVPVSGILSLPAPPQRVLVIGARTVLVDKDCNENPVGPGC